MDAEKLLKRIIEHGADERGIEDRFNGNAELYATCFEEFISDPNLELLHRSMEAGDYAQAFSAAHAIKGLSGNLGVTAFYKAVCRLVESLRSNRYAETGAEYAEVLRELGSLQALTCEQPAAASLAQAAAAKKPAPREKKKSQDTFLTVTIAVMVLFVACVGLLFVAILNNYRTSTAKESADHLVEITDQIALYIEERIASDWKTAGSIGDSIAYSNFQDDDEAILSLIQRQRDRWGVTGIAVYTEAGDSIRANNTVETNEAASIIVAKAGELGKYMSIIDSRITYAVPVDTTLTYKGSRIAAVAVIQNMDSFLDDMSFSSFGGAAWMYLTEQGGVVLSKLSNEAAVPTYNIKALLREGDISLLSDGVSEEELLSAPGAAVFTLSEGEENDYVVSTPVHTEPAPLRLFFLAPTDVVNSTMNTFSRKLSLLFMFVTAAIVAVAYIVFIYIYRDRKKRFDKALLSRERMFDLLVQNTQTAFALFSLDRDAPDYVSSNCERVIGDAYYTLHQTPDGYRMHNSAGTDAGPVRLLNERMRSWDGKGEFRSGYLQKDGASGWFSVQLFPADGAGETFVGIAQDVTAVHEREEVVRSALEMAEQANEAKSRFLSNMSHDIRTPMNAIVNMADFAMDSLDQPKKLGAYLQTIRESSDHLLHLINDVLDMSRIESGQTVVEAEPFSLKEEMQRQVDMIRPLSDAKRLTFITDFSGVHTEGVRGDRMKFSQILMNLLSNAVKFTPERGAIRFTATELPSLRENMVDIRCTVEDNGIGISEANQLHIFEPFSRAKDKAVSKIEGTGLGLSICRSYVDAMGGSLRCESEEGEGSIFILELFFERASFVPSREADATLNGNAPFLGMHCLLAEDNQTNQLIARTMLERLGFLIDVVPDGGECVQRFLASTPGTYDIVYMDIQMPVLDGYEAAVAIRKSRHPQAKTIPIIAMTANVFAEDVEKARVAGMDGHLGKPLSTLALVEETRLALGKRKDPP